MLALLLVAGLPAAAAQTQAEHVDTHSKTSTATPIQSSKCPAPAVYDIRSLPQTRERFQEAIRPFLLIFPVFCATYFALLGLLPLLLRRPIIIRQNIFTILLFCYILLSPSVEISLEAFLFGTVSEHATAFISVFAIIFLPAYWISRGIQIFGVTSDAYTEALQACAERFDFEVALPNSRGPGEFTTGSDVFTIKKPNFGSGFIRPLVTQRASPPIACMHFLEQWFREHPKALRPMPCIFMILHGCVFAMMFWLILAH